VYYNVFSTDGTGATPATLNDLRENIAMSCAAITLDTLQNIVHAAVRRLR